MSNWVIQLPADSIMRGQLETNEEMPGLAGCGHIYIKRLTSWYLLLWAPLVMSDKWDKQPALDIFIWPEGKLSLSKREEKTLIFISEILNEKTLLVNFGNQIIRKYERRLNSKGTLVVVDKRWLFKISSIGHWTLSLFFYSQNIV